MYKKHHIGIFHIIVLYFYDLLITGSSLASIDTIQTDSQQAFDMSDLGLIKPFLGLEITQNFDGIMISQSKYYLYLINKFNMEECKATPFLSGIFYTVGGFYTLSTIDWKYFVFDTFSTRHLLCHECCFKVHEAAP